MDRIKFSIMFEKQHVVNTRSSRLSQLHRECYEAKRLQSKTQKDTKENSEFRAKCFQIPDSDPPRDELQEEAQSRVLQPQVLPPCESIPAEKLQESTKRAVEGWDLTVMVCSGFIS